MSKLEDFKGFVKDNPGLLKYIKNKEMTWQSFYEMYDMYGSDNKVWEPYIKKEVEATATVDILSWLKNINIDKMQESINSVQRVLGVLEDLGSNNTKSTNTEYKPRPLYKHFED